MLSPYKAQTEVEDPDITDKLEELKYNNRIIETSYSPYTTNVRVVPKSRGPAKILEFSKDSAILSYLLSLSEKQLEELQVTSDAITERKKELEKVLVSEEDEQMYAEMIDKTNKEQKVLEEEDRKQKQNMQTKEKEEVGKISRIRERDRSRKIPTGKPIIQEGVNMKITTPADRITVTNIQILNPKMERIWEHIQRRRRPKAGTSGRRTLTDQNQ